MARQLATARDRLHAYVDTLTDVEAEELLDILNNLADPDTLTPEELARVLEGESQIARGESVTLEELQRELSL